MTNYEKFKRDFALIAKNHNFQCNVDTFEQDNEYPCIFGCNVPTLADVQALCDSLDFIQDFIHHSDFGIELLYFNAWIETIGTYEWIPQREMWLTPQQTTISL